MCVGSTNKLCLEKSTALLDYVAFRSLVFSGVRMVEDEQDPCCDPAENGRLPAEVWLLILEQLDLATQTVVAGTCRYWKPMIAGTCRYWKTVVAGTCKILLDSGCKYLNKNRDLQVFLAAQSSSISLVVCRLVCLLVGRPL